MRHIDHVVWKPLDWLPESPDQYPEGLWPDGHFKPEIADVRLENGWRVRIRSEQSSPVVEIRFQGEADEASGATGEGFDIPAAQVRELVDALLYVHRRTREHEYEGENGDVTMP